MTDHDVAERGLEQAALDKIVASAELLHQPLQVAKARLAEVERLARRGAAMLNKDWGKEVGTLLCARIGEARTRIKKVRT